MAPNQTAQQIDPNSTLGQGVPTQMPDSVAAIPNTIAPNPTSVPPAPTTPTLGQQGPSNPQAMPPTPSATSAPQTSHDVHQSLYQRALSILAPPTRYLDAQGNPQQTRPSLSNSILSGAIAGLLTPTAYRQGTFGPVADPQETAAKASAAGVQQRQDQDTNVQKHFDDLQARKLQVAANNTAAMHSYASMMGAQASAAKEGLEAENLQTKNWQDITDQNKSTILASADDYDNNLSDPKAPHARLTSGMTTQELLNSPFKKNMLSQLMVQDGIRPELDPTTGKTHMVPTWTVLNPEVDIKLNQAAVDRAAKIIPGMAGLWQATNGNVRMNLNRYAAINHQITSVNHAEDLLQSVADSKDPDLQALGIKGNVEGRLSDAVRGNSSAMRSLMEFENATAHGGSTADQLNRLLQSDGGDAIFKALGTDRDAVKNYVNTIARREESADALAKQGGMGEKAPASPTQTNALKSSIQNNPDLTDADKTNLLADVPSVGKDGLIHMTQGQVEKLTARLDSAVSMRAGIAEKNSLANGDPEQMKKTASNTIEGDVNDITKIASMRGNARVNAINAIHDEAAERGLDTTQYSEAALEAKANMSKDYQGGQKTPTGKQLISFDNYLGHSAALLDAEGRLESKTLGLTHEPIVNMTLKQIGNKLTDDKDWASYSAALEPVKHEIENFLAAGYATKSEDVANMNALLSDNLPLNQVKGVIRQLADTADVRLKGLGQSYVNTMGTTYPHLMSTDAQNALKRIGIDSKALPFTQPLPRGWVNHQATQMTDKNMARAYFQAAGNDRNAAVALAKNNGWILQ